MQKRGKAVLAMVGAAALAWPMPVLAQALSVESIIALAQAEVGDEAILAKLKADNVRFNLTADDMIALRRGGVSSAVIAAMIAPPAAASTSIASSPVAPALPRASAPMTATADPAGAKIIFYRRSSLIGAASACPIRFEDQQLVELGRGRFAEWPVSPGDYTLSNKNSVVKVTLAPGETGYVRCVPKSGGFTGRTDLQIGQEREFVRYRADFERKQVTQITR
jgi:hypothetical protein